MCFEFRTFSWEIVYLQMKVKLSFRIENRLYFIFLVEDMKKQRRDQNEIFYCTNYESYKNLFPNG